VEADDSNENGPNIEFDVLSLPVSCTSTRTGGDPTALSAWWPTVSGGGRRQVTKMSGLIAPDLDLEVHWNGQQSAFYTTITAAGQFMAQLAEQVGDGARAESAVARAESLPR
jgi:hypothetical protein